MAEACPAPVPARHAPCFQRFHPQMPPLRAALLTALLGLLALLIAWGLRSPRHAASGREADVVEPAKKAGPPPKRDFPRRPPAQDEVFADPPEEEMPGPGHPWAAYLARCAEVERKLRGAQPSLDFQNTSLLPILAALEDATGLKFHVDVPADTTSKEISFAVKELIAFHTLRLLLQQYDLMYVVAEDGELWIIPAQERPEVGQPIYPHEPAFVAELRAMRAVSGEVTAKPKDPAIAERNSRTNSAIKAAKLSLNLVETPLPEAISMIQEVTQLNVMIDRRRIEDPDATVVTATLADAPMEEALGACLNNTEFGWTTDDGVLVITTKQRIQEMAETEEAAKKRKAEIAAAENDLFSRTVAFGAENMRLRDVADVLAKGLGVPYQMDPATWARKARFTIEERQRPALEIVKLMRKGAPLIVVYRNGILWFLSPEGVK